VVRSSLAAQAGLVVMPMILYLVLLWFTTMILAVRTYTTCLITIFYKPGDQVIRVNGLITSECTHEEFINLIKNKRTLALAVKGIDINDRCVLLLLYIKQTWCLFQNTFTMITCIICWIAYHSKLPLDLYDQHYQIVVYMLSNNLFFSGRNDP
jgi:hypothetical protein